MAVQARYICLRCSAFVYAYGKNNYNNCQYYILFRLKWDMANGHGNLRASFSFSLSLSHSTNDVMYACAYIFSFITSFMVTFVAFDISVVGGPGTRVRTLTHCFWFHLIKLFQHSILYCVVLYTHTLVDMSSEGSSSLAIVHNKQFGIMRESLMHFIFNIMDGLYAFGGEHDVMWWR